MDAICEMNCTTATKELSQRIDEVRPDILDGISDKMVNTDQGGETGRAKIQDGAKICFDGYVCKCYCIIIILSCSVNKCDTYAKKERGQAIEFI